MKRFTIPRVAHCAGGCRSQSQTQQKEGVRRIIFVPSSVTG